MLLGSADGWAYCLRATDGALIWRFKALPDRLICAYEQVESAWPVCGSILVHGNVAYFVAGRNSFVDGGLFLFGLEPQSGRLIHQRNLYGPYGENGHPIISQVTALGATGAGGIEGNRGDILLAENGNLFLRHEAFTPDLKSVSPSERIPPHLITSHGFIEPIPHHRSWWTIDTILRYDLPTGRYPVHGDILVRDGTRLEGTTAHDWMRRAMGERGYAEIWEPMLRGKFKDDFDKVNMAWFWARFASRTPRLGYFEGGFQVFVDRLAAAVRLGLRVERINDAGHFVHREQPALFNRLLIEWLRAV